MGFHDNWRAPLQMTQLFHGIPWNIPWNSMELWCRQMKYQLVPWNSMEYSIEFRGTLVPPNDISLSSMEFHGTLVPPNEVSLSSMELWDCHSMAFYPGWTSKGYSIEFWSRQIKNHRVPWDSIELGGHHFKWHKYSMEFHGIFHGTLVPPNDISLSSMEFHGTFHGTLVPPNEVSLSSMEFHGTLRLPFYDLLPWTSKEYSTQFHGILESPNKKS